MFGTSRLSLSVLFSALICYLEEGSCSDTIVLFLFLFLFPFRSVLLSQHIIVHVIAASTGPKAVEDTSRYTNEPGTQPESARSIDLACD
jgi:hypothetical protein